MNIIPSWTSGINPHITSPKSLEKLAISQCNTKACESIIRWSHKRVMSVIARREIEICILEENPSACMSDIEMIGYTLYFNSIILEKLFPHDTFSKCTSRDIMIEWKKIQECDVFSNDTSMKQEEQNM